MKSTPQASQGKECNMLWEVCTYVGEGGGHTSVQHWLDEHKTLWGCTPDFPGSTTQGQGKKKMVWAIYKKRSSCRKQRNTVVRGVQRLFHGVSPWHASGLSPSPLELLMAVEGKQRMFCLVPPCQEKNNSDPTWTSNVSKGHPELWHRQEGLSWYVGQPVKRCGQPASLTTLPIFCPSAQPWGEIGTMDRKTVNGLPSATLLLKGWKKSIWCQWALISLNTSITIYPSILFSLKGEEIHLFKVALWSWNQIPQKHYKYFVLFSRKHVLHSGSNKTLLL